MLGSARYKSLVVGRTRAITMCQVPCGRPIVFLALLLLATVPILDCQQVRSSEELETAKEATELLISAQCANGGSSITATVTSTGDATSSISAGVTTTVLGSTPSTTSTVITSSGDGAQVLVNNLPFEIEGESGIIDIDICDFEVGSQNRFEKRPEGDWDFIVEARVKEAPDSIWDSLQDVGELLMISFENLATSISRSGLNTWNIVLNSNNMIRFQEQQIDDDNRHHILRWTSHSPDLFKDFRVAGTKLYFWVAPSEDSGSSVLEFGWQARTTPSRFSSSADIHLRSLFQELITNLENQFGEGCDFEKGFRTPVGNCNNLKRPRQGAFNHALLRLPKYDPSYEDDATSTPRGPKEISPRAISNMAHVESPGAEYLRDQATTLDGRCFTSSAEGFEWEVCPFKDTTVRNGADECSASWTGLEERDDQSMLFTWGDSGSCQLKLLFMCTGDEVVISKKAEGASSGSILDSWWGWLFSELACKEEAADDQVNPSKNGLTDMFWTFGQFVDHDSTLAPESSQLDPVQTGFKNSRPEVNREEFPIEVPEDDVFFKEEIKFERSATVPGSGNPREHINQHSAYLDLGQVYGVDYLRVTALRTFTDGKLKMSPTGLLPTNEFESLGTVVGNSPTDDNPKFFVAGDVRANEQVTLLAMHILWAREHNTVVDELTALIPEWDDEVLYQTARAIVISEYQSILYAEWLPLLLGSKAPNPDDHLYDEDVDCSVMSFFATVAFRFGHSMVSPLLWKLGPGSSATPDPVPLREVFFKPELVVTDGPDAFLRGASKHVAKELDVQINSELRNFLFEKVGFGTSVGDLPALNIQRARDMGIPAYNDARDAYGLPRYTDFSQISSDPLLWRLLDVMYDGNLDNVDPFTGGLAEDKDGDSELGEMMTTAVADQFLRCRDGDRFFYKRIKWNSDLLDQYSRLEEIMNDNVKLHDIIARNTGITLSELGVSETGTVFKAE